jgi:hypothetical protein
VVEFPGVPLPALLLSVVDSLFSFVGASLFLPIEQQFPMVEGREREKGSQRERGGREILKGVAKAREYWVLGCVGRMFV